jgi:hypothetical protein
MTESYIVTAGFGFGVDGLPWSFSSFQAAMQYATDIASSDEAADVPAIWIRCPDGTNVWSIEGLKAIAPFIEDWNAPRP